MERGRVAAAGDRHAARHARDLRRGQLLLPAKSLQENPGAQGESGRLQVELLLELAAQRLGDSLIVQLDAFCRPEEPFVNLPVQDHITEDHQEADRHEAQGQCAEI